MAALTRVCTFAVDNEQGSVVLFFDQSDPLVVQFDFGAGSRGSRIMWSISRDLLAAGLSGLAGMADVCCWVGGGNVYHIALSSHDGKATVRLSADRIRGLLIDAEELVPYGAEVPDSTVDAELAALLLTGGER